MMARRLRCWRVTDGKRWKRSFSTWRAAGSGRPPNEEPAGRELRHFRPPHRRDDRALLVPAALVLAAAPGTRLLAGGADDDVGLPAALYRGEFRVFRPRRRHLYRCGAAVGHPVPR